VIDNDREQGSRHMDMVKAGKHGERTRGQRYKHGKRQTWTELDSKQQANTENEPRENDIKEGASRDKQTRAQANKEYGIAENEIEEKENREKQTWEQANRKYDVTENEIEQGENR